MAKVDGPLFSLEARGKIADAVVYFPWKGRHVVRQWLKPTNKKSTLQGYVRASLKAVSKWIKEIHSVGQSDALDSIIYQACTSSAAAGMNWNAWIADGFLNALQVANVFKTTALAAIIAAYSSLNTTDLAAWETGASAQGIVDFAFGYGFTDNIPAGLQAYFGAHACYNQSIIGSAPYNTAPASWVVADIDQFISEMTSNA